MTRQLLIYVIALCLTAVGASSCAEKKGDADYSDNIFTEARFIRGHALPDSSVIISVVNPWDTTALLAQYRLVNAPDTTTVSGLPTLRLPLQRMVVYSSVHAGLLAESGQIDRIAGVADAQYITDDSIRARIADGRIVDIGSSMEPSLEKIVALRPDAILISPFKDAGHGVADRTGIPVIECADYMELSPMGRMEWTRFYSMLAEGMGRENDRMFHSVKARYDSLCSVASRFDKTPLVLTEMPEKGVWTLPGEGSYAVRIIRDANADVAVPTGDVPGSVPMPYEKVLTKAREADFWLIRTYGYDITADDIVKKQPLNARIRAFANGGVFNANTAVSRVFEDIAFHPDRVLRDYITIFHNTPDSLLYFHRVATP